MHAGRVLILDARGLSDRRHTPADAQQGIGGGPAMSKTLTVDGGVYALVLGLREFEDADVGIGTAA